MGTVAATAASVGATGLSPILGTRAEAQTATARRSDSDISMRLGEAFAVSVLQDKAREYHEKFTISFQKLDGTTATISKQGL